MARRFKHRSSAQHTPVSPKAFRRSSGRSLDAHRQWLLAMHGSVCAYCGAETSPEVITLDHVRPRQGKTAYDRPDNLVLACRPCNAAKADRPFLNFLLEKRSRAVFLLHYGEHLTDPIKEIVRKACERPLLEADEGSRPNPTGLRFRRGRK